jgi:hypothetical protein
LKFLYFEVWLSKKSEFWEFMCPQQKYFQILVIISNFLFSKDNIVKKWEHTEKCEKTLFLVIFQISKFNFLSFLVFHPKKKSFLEIRSELLFPPIKISVRKNKN